MCFNNFNSFIVNQGWSCNDNSFYIYIYLGDGVIQSEASLFIVIKVQDYSLTVNMRLSELSLFVTYQDSHLWHINEASKQFQRESTSH